MRPFRIILGATLLASVTIGPLASFAATQSPFSRTVDIEQYTSDASRTALSDEQKARDALKGYINSIGGEVQFLESAYGTINDQNEYVKGSFDALKLKPSDKKRLIKLANGSLTDREKSQIAYDANLMTLLTKLTTPKELGGGGIKHLRVGDLLRLRNDPRSRETEASDNISQHQFGKAADIIEINQTHCTESSLLGGSEDLPPFPVKVIWQGGAPYNPSSAILSTFDASARANAMRDILGTLPSDGYEGNNVSLSEILNQLQRRVIADELGLDRSSLDFLQNGDFLLTLGQAVINDSLNYPTGALSGDSTEEIIRSLPQSYVEDSLRLPPGSFKGDTVQQAIERLGRYKAAMDAGTPVSDVLNGNVDGIKNSVTYSYYGRAEAAFGLPAGTLAGIKNNQSSAFAAIGAKLIATRLRYSESETETLITEAQNGTVKQLSLARIGDISRIPLNILPVIAPTAESSKKAGEIALGNLILGQNSSTTTAHLPESVVSVITSKLKGIDATSTRQEIGQSLIESKSRTKILRLVGAGVMEDVFSLPPGSLTDAINSNDAPTHDQFIKSLGKSAVEAGEAKGIDYTSVGNSYMRTTVRSNFNEFYHSSPVGLGAVADRDIAAILLGQPTSATTRAGASWVEEDLGLAPESFGVLFTEAPLNKRLIAAGVSVLAGELFEAFDVSTQNLSDSTSILTAMGQAKIETVLGLVPGSFAGELDELKDKNSERFSQIFAKSSTVDALVGLESGATESILKGQRKLETASLEVGKKILPKLQNDTLENKFGWDSRYPINGNDLAAGLEGRTVGSGVNATTPNALEILATIGGYNTDFAFGWDPNTTAQFMGAGAAGQNAFIVAQGAKGFAQNLGLNLKHPSDLLKAYKEGLSTVSGEATRYYQPTVETVITEAMKKRLDLPGLPASEQVPNRDLSSLLRGDIPTVNYAIIAVNQAKQMKQTFEQAYQLYRILISGSGSDLDFELKLNQEGFDRYQRVLADIAQTHLSELTDKSLERMTTGIVDASGILNFTQSPYTQTALQALSLAYFSTKEARNTFFYTTLDAQMRQTNPDLPLDFAKTLMEGSNLDRSVMLFDYIDGKVTEAVLNELPAELRPLAIAWLNDEDITIGRELTNSPQFQTWMASTFASIGGINLPEPAIKLLMDYATGSIDPDIFTSDPSLVLSISPSSMADMIDNALGFSGGEFGEYYDKYKEIQSLYSDYQSGNLDAGQAIFAVDAILFDGKLAELTQSIDSALGLPGGSTQLLIQYAMTGNPLYLAQFAFNLFFGSTIECPDLQEEAQKNVQLLLKEIIRLGDNTARLIPSQIITYKQSYLGNLAADIRKNYSVCLDTQGARCGVFARPEYAKQVHIGF